MGDRGSDWLKELGRFLKPFLDPLGRKAPDVPCLRVRAGRSWGPQEHSANGGAACTWWLHVMCPSQRLAFDTTLGNKRP
jgi:hypothetical protein